MKPKVSLFDFLGEKIKQNPYFRKEFWFAWCYIKRLKGNLVQNQSCSRNC